MAKSGYFHCNENKSYEYLDTSWYMVRTEGSYSQDVVVLAEISDLVVQS